MLVDRFPTYSTCDGYCASIGKTCVGAWEEISDTCSVEYDMTCDQSIESSDALCQCSPDTPLPVFGELDTDGDSCISEAESDLTSSEFTSAAGGDDCMSSQEFDVLIAAIVAAGGLDKYRAANAVPFTATGSCIVEGSCVSSGATQEYGPNEACEITVGVTGIINTETFHTEKCCDKLTLSTGQSWSGSTGPKDLAVDHGDSFVWSSDSTISGVGWRICFSAPLLGGRLIAYDQSEFYSAGGSGVITLLSDEEVLEIQEMVAEHGADSITLETDVDLAVKRNDSKHPSYIKYLDLLTNTIKQWTGMGTGNTDWLSIHVESQNAYSLILRCDGQDRSESERAQCNPLTFDGHDQVLLIEVNFDPLGTGSSCYNAVNSPGGGACGRNEWKFSGTKYLVRHAGQSGSTSTDHTAPSAEHTPFAANHSHGGYEGSCNIGFKIPGISSHLCEPHVLDLPSTHNVTTYAELLVCTASLDLPGLTVV